MAQSKTLWVLARGLAGAVVALVLMACAPAEAAQLKAPASAGSAHASVIVLAQAANGAFDPQRDCQTLRTCRYAKGGSFRGCVSTYSCRTCRYVPSTCSVGSGTGACRRQVCSFGA